MSTNKYITLFIIFFLVMPFKVTIGQEADSDTAQGSELDIKYDLVLSKAASSLSDSAYKEAIVYYKEASSLKPNETYPSKMIKYAENIMSEVAAKQKRADDLKRKAQIRDVLFKANQAIVDRNWDSAKLYFNEILTLQPEKTDEEYAKSKVQAIDLELQRIALRTPIKEEPKPVFVPRNRREARAQRKLEERNQSSAALNKSRTQKPVEIIKTSSAPLASAKNNQKSIASSATGTSAAKKINYQILQRFKGDFKDASNINWTITSTFAKADFLQDEEKVEAFYDLDGVLIGTSYHISLNELPKEAKKILATRYAQYNVTEVIRYEGMEEAAYYIATEDIKEKVVFRLSGNKDVSVFSRELKGKNAEIASGLRKDIVQKSIETSLQDKKAAVASSSPKEMPQKPIEAPLPDKKVTIASSAPEETPQKPIEAPLPAKKVTVASSALKEVPQKPIETPLPGKKVVVDSSAPKEMPQKPIEAPLPDKKVTIASSVPKEMPQKLIEAQLPDKKPAVAASSPTKVIPQKTTELPSAGKKLTVVSPSTEKVPPSPTEAPELKFFDSSDYVKLTCQDISFIGTNAYIKMLVQNFSTTTNFLTDTLQVSIKKNNGIVKKLDQRFISNFPVVKPLDEYVLVYFADASIAVEPDDIFILEMENRMKKTKLVIQVPWSLYKQQRAF